MTITDTTTVGEIAGALPASVRVFQRHGIDFCCGGKKPLTVVCREHGLSFTEIASAIEVAADAGTREERDWSQEPLGALIRHIVTAHHQPLREELPRLVAMARKVAQVHGVAAPRLARVASIVEELAAGLVAHMKREEVVLFPIIDALAIGTLRRMTSLQAPIAVMEYEHDDAGALLAELRALTDGYQPPSWGCATLRALYHGLAELESGMQVHVHLENNVLFPRALDLTAAANG